MVAELSMEVQQLRHCLAVVTNVAAVELAVLSPALFASSLKRQLWRTLAPWSQEASPDAKPGSYRAEVCPPPPLGGARLSLFFMIDATHLQDMGPGVIGSRKLGDRNSFVRR